MPKIEAERGLMGVGTSVIKLWAHDVHIQPLCPTYPHGKRDEVIALHRVQIHNPNGSNVVQRTVVSISVDNKYCYDIHR